MNILLVSHYALPHSGGIEVVVDQLGAELSRAAHRVTVLSSRTGGAAPRERRGAVELVRIAAANGLERWLDVPYPLFAPELWGAAHAEKLKAQKLIKTLEQKPNTKRRLLFEAQDDVDKKRADLIEEIERQFEAKTAIQSLFALRWALSAPKGDGNAIEFEGIGSER